MFTVYFTNVRYMAQETFASADEALAAAKSWGFEAQIYDHNVEIVATWSPLYGTRRYDGVKS